jgi:putative alpha-1,2-mannosidase
MLFALWLMLSPACFQAQSTASPLALVDPLVGTLNGGNTTPGAQVPFGFISLGPDTTSDSGFTSGYDPAAQMIGFSCTHESGTGGESKYGNFRTTPTVGELSPRNLLYPWKDEHAEPGYYAVTLGQAGRQVRSELTATRMVAISRYTFPAHAQANLLLEVSSRIRRWHGHIDRCTPRRRLHHHVRRLEPNALYALLRRGTGPRCHRSRHLG